MAELEDNWEQVVQVPATAAGRSSPKLIVVYSPFRRLIGPLKQVVSDLRQAHPKRDLAVLVPELVLTRWYHYLLHNNRPEAIRALLLFNGNYRITVVSLPYHLRT